MNITEKIDDSILADIAARGENPHASIALELQSLRAEQPHPWLAKLPQLAKSGEVPGGDLQDWPEWCVTFNERLAYQQGVADARAMGTQPSDAESWQSSLAAMLYQHEQGNASVAWMADAIRGVLEQFGSSSQPPAELHMQPIIKDPNGVVRFKSNEIVYALYEYSKARGFGMNEIAIAVACGNSSAEDYGQLMQLIGYSVSGYCCLTHTPKATAIEAERRAALL